jgi:hypothetical protein
MRKEEARRTPKGRNMKTLLIAIGAGIMAFGVIGLMAMAQVTT